MNRNMNGPGRVFPRPVGSAFWAGIACFCVFSACLAWGEEEWRPKLDAGDRSTLSVGYEENWTHADGSSAEEEQWATLGDEELADLSSAPDEAARRAVLESGDDEALAKALEEAETHIDELGRAIPTIHRDIRRLQVQALRDSPKAKEIHAEIKRLEEELDAYAESLPEVAARRETLEAVNRNLMSELRFRRELRNKIEQTKPILEP